MPLTRPQNATIVACTQVGHNFLLLFLLEPFLFQDASGETRWGTMANSVLLQRQTCLVLCAPAEREFSILGPV